MKRLIRRLLHDGYNAPEVAVLAGVHPRRVHRLARRIGVSLPVGLGDNARRISVVLPKGCLPALDDMASRAGVGRGEFLARAFLVELEDGGRHLIRRMARLARRPRKYDRGGQP